MTFNWKWVILTLDSLDSQTATAKPEQQWYVKGGENTKIQLANTTLCIDAGAKSEWCHRHSDPDNREKNKD